MQQRLTPIGSRLDIALQALHYCLAIEVGLVVGSPGVGTQQVSARPLIEPELALRRTSLEVLRLFVAGEIDLVPARAEPDRTPEDPGSAR
jgi:hypothetical protein